MTISSAIDYEWPRNVAIKEPFAHQIQTTEFLIRHPRAFCLNDMGTGKTLSALWAYDYLRRQDKVKSMLVVCPLSTMVSTWGSEITKNFRGILRHKVLHEETVEKRVRALHEQAHIYIINPAGLRQERIQEELSKRQDIDLIIVDEIAQVGRNPGTEIYKTLLQVINRQFSRMAWGLTGAPIPNGPSDVWGQCKILGVGNVSPYFRKFKEEVEFKREELEKPYYKNFNEVTHILRKRSLKESLELALENMQPSIRFVRDQCIDLPPLLTQTISIGMSKQQTKAYNEMLITFRAEYKRGLITASNELVKVNKLLQIACGVPYVEGGGSVVFPIEDRLSAVKEIIENANSKVIVFVPFVEALATVTNFLQKSFTVQSISGKTPMSARIEIISDFQEKQDPHVLIANPASMSHGITLTAASTIIWFSPIWSNDITLQANCRITRPGQKLNQLIVNIEGSSVERKVYERIRLKGKVQGMFLEMLAEME